MQKVGGAQIYQINKPVGLANLSNLIELFFCQLTAMAEAPDTKDKRLDKLEEEITFAVCRGHYQQAKLLPCSHYYCRACIEELAKRSRGRPFACPECRKEATLPPGGVEELQGAFLVERMKDMYENMAKAEGKVEAVCEQCTGCRFLSSVH